MTKQESILCFVINSQTISALVKKAMFLPMLLPAKSAFKQIYYSYMIRRTVLNLAGRQVVWDQQKRFIWE